MNISISKLCKKCAEKIRAADREEKRKWRAGIEELKKPIVRQKEQCEEHEEVDCITCKTAPTKIPKLYG